jgi:hypothetical protein
MSAIPDPVVFPELIFGIAGPIGVDIDGISKAIVERLDVVRYRAVPIKLTDEMKDINIDVDVDAPASNGKFDEYWWKMDYANALRKHYEKPDALARIAVNAIRIARANENIRLKNANNNDHTQHSAADFDEATKHPNERDRLTARKLISLHTSHIRLCEE